MTRVVVRYDEHGNVDYYSDGGSVDLFIIDERCPRDRIYRHGSHVAEAGSIDALIGSDRIGSLGDMPGAEASIRAMMNGKPLPSPSLRLID